MAFVEFSLGLGETKWHRCGRCKCMFWARPPGGKCAYGTPHFVEGIDEYIMWSSNVMYQVNYQTNWRWCERCGALFFGGGNGGVCPVNQGAHHRSSENYVLSKLNYPGDGNQVNWMYCSKCACLVWTTPGLTKCAAGGSHNVLQSGKYRLSVLLS